MGQKFSRLNLKQQKLLVDLILSNGFAISDFEFNPKDKDGFWSNMLASFAFEDIDRIIYGGTKYYFIITTSAFTGYSISYMPNPELNFLMVAEPFNKGFKKSEFEEEFPVYFTQWLNVLREQTSLEKELNNLFNAKVSYEDSKYYNETKFTESEITELRKRIDELEKKIRKLNLEKNQQDELIKTLQRLKEEAVKQTKINWRDIFVGAIISTLMAKSIVGAAASGIFAIAVELVINPNMLSQRDSNV